MASFFEIGRLKEWLVRQIRERILYQIPLTNPDPNVVLFIRLDGIGDYLLLRNFIPYLREADILRGGKKLVFIGSDTFRSFVETFDADVFDDCVWINIHPFLRLSYYRKWRYIWQIRQKYRAMTSLQTKHDRQHLDEMIVQVLGSPCKITSAGDDSVLGAALKKRSDKLYPIKLPTLAHSYFEFERNRFFFEQLIGRKINLPKPFIDLKKPVQRDGDLVCFYPSSSVNLRRWSPEHFAELAILILQTYPKIRFEILGTEGDKFLADRIQDCLSANFPILSLCGKTRLDELVYKIASARLLISNDTSGQHFAAALDTPCVCISYGNHFQRFNPYPKSMTDKHFTVYPTDEFYDPNQFKTLADKFRIYQAPSAPFDINSISPERVFERVKILLDKF